MRRAFIAFGIGVFLIYCWASVAYQNEVDVPGYRSVEIDLLGGASRADWENDTQIQFQRLMELEAKNYQLPEDARVEAKAGGYIPVERPLTSDDFAWMIAAAPSGQQPVKVALRDTGAIYGLLGHHYLLRDSIPQPGNPDGPPLYMGGSPLDKEMLDGLRARGVKVIRITGHGDPVGFQLGTALMVAIIFLTLVAALKPLLWDPFLMMLEKRRRELDVGGEAERQNQQEAVRFQEEERRRRTELDRELQELRLREQRETALRAGEILDAAREKEKEVKMRGLRTLGAASKQAEEELENVIPELAEAVADALTPGHAGPRWDIMVDGGPGENAQRGDD